MTWPAQHLSVAIARPPQDVYDFASEPANLPSWAAGLGARVEQVGRDWVAESPMGRVKVRFAERNRFGVLDHDVTLPSGETLTNPMRVVANDRGSEVVFTLFRRPGVTEQALAEDARAVARDLQSLKQRLEQGPPRPRTGAPGEAPARRAGT